MTLVAGNVRVGVTGAVYFAPTGTAVPTTAIASRNAAFGDVGYIGEDGVTTSVGADTAEIKAWQNGDIVRRVQTSHDFTIQFSMIETNAKSLELYYGNYTAGTGVVQITGEQPYRGAFVVHVVDDTDLIRIVIPDGQVSERGDVSYVNENAVSLDVTITCYPDASGVKGYIYFETVGAS
jgi:hypothetical protein